MKITVAEIINTHGIRGNLKIKSYSDNENRFNKDSKLFLDDEEVVIESSFKHKGSIIIKLKNYDDINEVEKFIGHELTIDENDLEDLNNGEYYLFDLIGLRVYENGEKIGSVVDVITGVYPNDIYVIEKNGKEVYFPALNATIKNIDLENKKIEVENFKDYE
ncbi:16S rRNA processing protein RimM [Anaerococcus sp. AGMB00486]|uniref:Ribosome maturation factor RimM n=2 Tax=Anaerococcus TaxID=165779 RepID=A0ABX2N9L4_9FIRM|nr:MULTISPECIES: ribosome maturation factor RimM [Anaerococcus]MDY3006791.1 ribosome maturation factor RimM [Anaerococcus porci]MSS78507.1 16S rRNA processing protein RimM [Anaerococcus porci]NVF11364.1 16S rRNA processing protein RimM [Anaerococcus faecalis]